MRSGRREGPYVFVAMQGVFVVTVFAATSLWFAKVPILFLVILAVGVLGTAWWWLLGCSVSIDGDAVAISSGRFRPAATVRLGAIRSMRLTHPWFALRSQVRILSVVDAQMREYRIPAISVGGPLYMFDLKPGGEPPRLGPLARSIERSGVSIQVD